LSGDGGDENFAGYRRYLYDVLENRYRNFFPEFFRKYLIGGLASIYPKADWLPQIFRAKTFLKNLSRDPVEGYYNTMTHFSPEQQNLLFNHEVRENLKNYSSLDGFKKHYENAQCEDLLSRIQYLDMKTYRVDDILTKVDRASMAHSLEVRVPLLDHVFMEYVAQMPSQLKLNGQQGKYIFKKMAENNLPKQIIKRKKMGFSIPLDDWFRNELRNIFLKEVLEKNTGMEEFFNMRFLQSLWRKHQLNLKNYGVQLWAVLMFAKWSKTILNNIKP
jgi:asparagine synthase (glutamine-hydrolysing)